MLFRSSFKTLVTTFCGSIARELLTQARFTTINQEKSVSGLWANGPQATTAISPKGPCPAGFSRSSGHMRALKINVPNTTYIATVTFGDQKQDKVSWYMRSV